MVRRILLMTLGLLLFAAIVGSATTYVLADNGRFLPGERLFHAQWSAEQFWLIRLPRASLPQAQSALQLLDRRLDNLEACQDQPCAGPTLPYLEFAVGQALTAVHNAPAADQPDLRQELYTHVRRALGLMDTAGASANELAARLESLLVALQEPEPEGTAVAQLNGEAIEVVNGRAADGFASSPPNPSLNQLAAPLTVPFPEGAVDHSFFPLTGGHDSLECTTCHTSGDYKGTSSTCVACHAKDEPHAGQYGDTCTNCHVIESWQIINFDHTVVRDQDCAACHTPPENHYQGACSACHSDTTDFRNANFNHATIGSTDCAACHTPPENHYQGACRDCHTDTSNFRNANFNHATIGGTDCSACHAPPANHYQGACRDCHTDTSNFRNANFNHATIGGTDCSACHAPPANHYQGACRDCHTDTSNFRNANFNHAGLTDCQSCHSRPENHFAGQCSDCHTTNGWGGASFNHTFPINHEGANGNCSTCHPGNDTTTYTCTTCHDQERMDRKHQEEGGYTGNNCVQCHPDGREHDD